MLSADGAVVSVEITPLVVGVAVGVERELHLIAVLKALDQDLGVFPALVEYELQVSGLSYLEVLEIVFELAGIGHATLGHVDAHNDVERAQIGVMAKAQGCNVIALSVNDQFGLLKNILHDGFHYVDVPVPVAV